MTQKVLKLLLSNEQHSEIKSKASLAGKSMKMFILDKLMKTSGEALVKEINKINTKTKKQKEYGYPKSKSIR